MSPLPCPFCGSVPEVRPELRFVQCPAKDCHVFALGENHAEALEKWNRRVSAAPCATVAP